MKKYSPGCLCCGKDCTDNCYFPCTGGEEITDCLICGVDIQLPTPDTTGLDPLVIPNPGCPDEAPCFLCYQWFDRLFAFYFYGDINDRPEQPGQTCDDWNFFWSIDPFSFGYSFEILRANNFRVRAASCWNAQDYNCPYDNDLSLFACDASNVALSGSWTSAGIPANVQLLGNEWNGSCGKLTVTARYTAVEWQVGFSTIPIGDPEECVDPKWTEFIHTFELEYCDCSELFNEFTYIGTETTDSCAGGVDDPCNFAEASIRLKPRPERDAYCGVCTCANCVGQRPDQFLLTVSGPVINGTFVLETIGNIFEGQCFYQYSLPIAACEAFLAFQLQIKCLPCDKLEAFLSIRVVANYYAWIGKTDVFDCGDSPTFNELDSGNGTAPCQLSGHTFQLSFVPA